MQNRLKDTSPLKTVATIKGILGGLGVPTVENWYESNLPNLYSVRITIAESDIGVNGKGATKDLALASGYGEFIERWQNGLLPSALTGDVKWRRFGCVDISCADLIAKSPIVLSIVRAMGAGETVPAQSPSDVFEKLRKWPGFHDLAMSDTVSSVPFLDVGHKSNVFVPSALLDSYGSHGMAAGNTYKEALVQAISEIFERYCQRVILRRRLCPPLIPRSYIFEHFPEIGAYVDAIEAEGSTTVSIRDCSLGSGFPVYCVTMVNRQTQAYSVVFASHPNASVAMERLFTEAFQGRSTKEFVNSIERKPLPEPFNTNSIFKYSTGAYPFEFWSGRTSYEWDPSAIQAEFSDNDRAFAACRSFCEKKGFHICVRDVGYLGFPAVHVVIPGLSEIFGCDENTLNYRETLRSVLSKLGKVDEMPRDDQELAFNIIDFSRKMGLAGDADLGRYFTGDGWALKGEEKAVGFLVLLSTQIGYTAKGGVLSQRLGKMLGEARGGVVFRCAGTLLECVSDGLGLDAAYSVALQFYPPQVCEKARSFIGQRLCSLVRKHAVLERPSSNIDFDALWHAAASFEPQVGRGI